MPGHVLHEAQCYVVTVLATRCNAQYSFKTTRLKTFGSHLVYTFNSVCYLQVCVVLCLVWIMLQLI